MNAFVRRGGDAIGWNETRRGDDASRVGVGSGSRSGSASSVLRSEGNALLARGVKVALGAGAGVFVGIGAIYGDWTLAFLSAFGTSYCLYFLLIMLLLNADSLGIRA